MNYESSCCEIVALTKAMQILTDVNTKLLKTGFVNVIKSNDNRKVSLEIAKFLKDSGEGRFFFIAGRCEKAIKKVVLEPLARVLAERLFYINDIIASLQKPKK